jgi:DNA-directed RNA polymerase specialized sigma24 family protein
MHGIEREEYARQLHARLLELDPVAPAEFAEAFLDELVRRLEAKAGPSYEETLLHDAATDALVNYIQHPRKFNPRKSALLTYLTMAAYRDLLNMIAKEQRRRRHEVPLQDVEETLTGGNNIVEPEDQMFNNLPTAERAELLRAVAQMFPDPRDQAFLELMADGERRTTIFSDVLGIQSLPVDEQRKIVKQHKDRITKRLQRLRGKIHGK